MSMAELTAEQRRFVEQVRDRPLRIEVPAKNGQGPLLPRPRCHAQKTDVYCPRRS